MKKLFILFLLIINQTFAQDLLDSAKILYVDGKIDQSYSILNTISNTQYLNETHALKAKILGQKNLYTKAYKILDDENLDATNPTYLSIINTKAFLLENEGFPNDALNVLTQGITTFKEFQNDDQYRLFFVENYSLQGTAYWQLGENNEATEYLNQSLNLAKKLNDPILEANCFINIGLVHSKNDTFKAQINYEKALEEYRKVYPNEDHPSIASIYINLGILFEKNFFVDKAINSFEKASNIWSKFYGDEHPNVAFTYIFIADAYLKSGQVELANEYYNFSLELYQNVFGNKHPEIANIYIKQGDIALDKGDYKNSLALFQKALIANNHEFNSTNIKDFPSISNYLNPFINLVALQKKAEVLEQIHYGKSLKRNDLNLGIQSLELAHQLINKIRGNQKSEQDKIKLSEITNNIYADAIRLSIALGEASIAKEKWNNKAFDFMEWSKSATLQQAIQDTHAKSFAGIPKTLIEKENNFRDEINGLEKGIINASSVDEREQLIVQLFEKETDLDRFINQLETDYPKYFQLKYSTKTITAKEIKEKLPKNTALVSYFIADKEELLYIFLIANKQLYIFTQDFDEDFKDEIVSLKSGLKFNFEEIISMSTEYLTDRLLPFTFNKNIEKIIFIPDGKINSIPLDILYYTSVSENTDPKDLPFLVKKYATSYNFSATIALQESNADNFNTTLTCFAPIQFKDSNGIDEFDPLPGTLSEVNEIKSITENAGWSTNNYIYEKAKISLLKDQDVSNSGYIHFATHGVVNEENPNQSFIYLVDEKSDGLLFASDIYNLDLNARLVTLSACETGLGKISKGEGLIGLSRSLKYAGVENSVVSLWTINDISSALFMQYFYQELTKNKDISLALQKAKIKLFQGRVYNSPYYWAAFSLIGS
ncbi:CHAT domain-containing protein [Flammeovirga pacifica]|uniref:CHAT domain-containing protein n=1 Tax=Flammeovirga pacifica TaxID=915059 RepID=A0A1S1YWC2_FLAPC|nr:CHAT domain-containing protein [Flammeovirga pacifica]OHX65311.1 hypothetical protein NH26_02580 [Flammeovirga pacifica]